MSQKKESTLVLIKPEGIQKELTGIVLTRFAETKLKLVGAKMKKVDRKLAEVHYEALKDKKFFGELLQYIMGELHGSSPVLALVYEGPDAIKKVRDICGATNPEDAEPTSIRGAYGRITTKGVFENVVHASANPEDAKREIQLWFRPDELVVNGYSK